MASNRPPFYGLSTDTKPTNASLEQSGDRPLNIGDLYVETDTYNVFEWRGSWVQIEAGGRRAITLLRTESSTLFSAASADGNSSSITWAGGSGTFTSWGTFGSGTCTLQFSPDAGTTWIAVPGASLAANGAINFSIGGCLLRASLSGSTSPSLNAMVL